MRISDKDLKHNLEDGEQDEVADIFDKVALDLRDAREAIRKLLSWDWTPIIHEDFPLPPEDKAEIIEDLDNLRKQVEQL